MLIRLKQRKFSTGFTLVEVMVTIVVVSIGLLGLAGLQISGLRANMSSEARSKATLMANDIIERMRANPLGLNNAAVPADDNQYAGIDTGANVAAANARCAALPAPFCSNSRGNNLAQNCTAAQMAVFDAWVWGCGMPVAGNVLPGGVVNQLPNGRGTVICNDADGGVDGDACTIGSTYTVTVSWSELSPNANPDANVAAGDDTIKTISLVVVP